MNIPNSNPSSKQQGFTLIEILVVIGLIALLAAIVIIAINPARQFAQGRDAQRTNDVTAILNAVGQYTADNKGILPPGLTTSDQDIASSAGIDLCTPLVPKYLAAFPIDPKTGTPAGSGVIDCTTYSSKYKIKTDANGRVIVSATPEIATSITVTR